MAITLGTIGIAGVLAGAFLALTGQEGITSPLAGVLIRTGAILTALGLVLPSIRKPSMTVLVLTGAGVLLVLARPALVWLALGGWLLAVVMSRQRKTASKDS